MGSPLAFRSNPMWTFQLLQLTHVHCRSPDSLVGWDQTALNKSSQHRTGAQNLFKGESRVWPNPTGASFMEGHQKPVLGHLICVSLVTFRPLLEDLVQGVGSVPHGSALLLDWEAANELLHLVAIGMFPT